MILQPIANRHSLHQENEGKKRRKNGAAEMRNILNTGSNLRDRATWREKSSPKNQYKVTVSLWGRETVSVFLGLHTVYPDAGPTRL